MGSSLKGLTMAASIFMTCVLISFSLLILREGKLLGNQFVKELREEERLYGERKWTRYDGAIVSGAEVINAISRFQKQIPITVNNKIQEATYSKENLFQLFENNSASLTYIEPFEDYIGEIKRRLNGDIYLIRFIKRG